MATPLAFVTAVPTEELSTLNVIVAPDTPALVSLRVKVALKLTGPAEPLGTVAGLGAERTSVVETVELTVSETEPKLEPKAEDPLPKPL